MICEGLTLIVAHKCRIRHELEFRGGFQDVLSGGDARTMGPKCYSSIATETYEVFLEDGPNVGQAASLPKRIPTLASRFPSRIGQKQQNGQIGCLSQCLRHHDRMALNTRLHEVHPGK